MTAPAASLASLKCEDHADTQAMRAAIESMVYWEDIKADEAWTSPYMKANDAKGAGKRYVVFDPDHGGWNNIRMGMETILVFAALTGRTLVIPPKQKMYLLGKDKGEKNKLSFEDFFDLSSIAAHLDALDVITMDEFLKAEGGKLREVDSEGKEGAVVELPGGRTDWAAGGDTRKLKEYLARVGYVRPMTTTKDFLVIPEDPEKSSVRDMQYLTDLDVFEGDVRKKWDREVRASYNDNPTSTTAEPQERMREFYAGRSKMHVYDAAYQDAKVVYFPVKHRMLIHFYAFIFSEDWRADLWAKRFVRDHVRYIDHVYCNAAAVVAKVREKSLKNDPEGGGVFDTLHVRRGDFQYKIVKRTSEQLYEDSKEHLTPGSTLFIATDEFDKSYWEIFKTHYDVYFLDDFMDALKGVSPNYFGMLDQLVAVQGRVFYGTFFSTFSSYINRIRGYHDDRGDELTGSPKDGKIKSWYFFPEDRKNEMVVYMPSRPPFYSREFPAGWRDIDADVME